MGRPRKAIEKRISGTGYTKSEAARLKFCKKNRSGKYEIDVEEIEKRITQYLSDKTNEESGKIEETISRPSIRKALGYISGETYALWLKGYVNREHIDDEKFEANKKLAEVMRIGQTEIDIQLLETNEKYGDNKRIRLAESYGLIAPSKQLIDHKLTGRVELGKFSKYAK